MDQDELKRALDDEDYRVAGAAARELLSTGSVETLLEVLRGRSRGSLLAERCLYGIQAAVPWLLAQLAGAGEDPRFRGALLRVLARAGDRETVERLAEEAAGAGDEQAMQITAAGLERFKDKPASPTFSEERGVQELLDALKYDVSQRWSAADSLLEMDWSEIIDELAFLLFSGYRQGSGLRPMRSGQGATAWPSTLSPKPSKRGTRVTRWRSPPGPRSILSPSADLFNRAAHAGEMGRGEQGQGASVHDVVDRHTSICEVCYHS